MAESPQIIGTRRKWGGSRDTEGHRTFTVTHLVEVGNTEDGPAIVMSTPGLPVTGSYWQFGNDLDFWAFCYPDMRVSIHEEKEGQKNKIWRVDQKFSTKPFNRCQDIEIEDPILEPDRISGGFTRATKEVSRGYSSLNAAVGGGPRDVTLETSSHEPLLGIQRDDSRPTIRIETNDLVLGLNIFTPLIDTVNNAIVWELPKRTIKLTNVTWERKILGTCGYYFTRIYDFEVNFNTFDTTAPDYGSLALRGTWDADCDTPVWTTTGGQDKDNLHHFRPFHDCHEVLRKTYLDGNGAAVAAVASAAEIPIIYYVESDFSLLGINIRTLGG